MKYAKETLVRTHAGALEALSAAIQVAEAMTVPQCIVIVDCSGETIASARMDGAKYLACHNPLFRLGIKEVYGGKIASQRDDIAGVHVETISNGRDDGGGPQQGGDLHFSASGFYE